jgi:pimeloyl-ACP methyl ester carboxylesterase
VAKSNTTNLSGTPILFVHGNGDSSALWLTTVWRFESNGYPRALLHALDFPSPSARDEDDVPQANRSSTEEQRAFLAAEVEALLARTGAERVALVGNSRGGNAIRSYVKHGGAARVSHAVLCGTPNHGVVAVEGSNNEFNALGRFLREMNAGEEVAPGVAFMAIRSERDDLYAQPILASGVPGTGYASPELRGATNVVLPGIDHRETAYGPQAFAAMYEFITGEPPATTDVLPEREVVLSGRITGYEHGTPTNRGVPGVELAIYAIDQESGERIGAARYAQTTGGDGAWGPFAGRPDEWYEFVVAAPGQPVRHFFRSPFPRSSPSVHLRLFEDAPLADQGLIVFTRPRGYVADGRDRHLLDGRPVPDVRPGVPVESRFTVPFAGPARPVRAELNGETLVARSVPGAVVYAEFHS